jgi:hypothetical protein
VRSAAGGLCPPEACARGLGRSGPIAALRRRLLLSVETDGRGTSRVGPACCGFSLQSDHPIYNHASARANRTSDAHWVPIPAGGRRKRSRQQAGRTVGIRHTVRTAVLWWRVHDQRPRATRDLLHDLLPGSGLSAGRQLLIRPGFIPTPRPGEHPSRTRDLVGPGRGPRRTPECIRPGQSASQPGPTARPPPRRLHGPSRM